MYLMIPKSGAISTDGHALGYYFVCNIVEVIFAKMFKAVFKERKKKSTFFLKEVDFSPH
jgi:hypothetical protein